MFPTWSDWDITYTSKGLLKKRAKTMLTYLACVLAIPSILSLRRNTRSVECVKALLKEYIRQALLKGADILQVAGSKL